MTSEPTPLYIRWFEELRRADIGAVGGKNASLGELVAALGSAGVRVPSGYAVTTAGYRRFVEHNEIARKLGALLERFDASESELSSVGSKIRALFREGEIPDDLGDEICAAYRQLSQRYGEEKTDVAVRSSATAEDLPEASFAGQLDTFLNIRGEHDLLEACRECCASLFTDRAIAYRAKRGFDQHDVALSIGIQKMVRSDTAGAGVMFTIDTESGFPDAILINAAWGIGETVVSGSVIPDQYVVMKSLLDREACKPILEKSRGAKATKMVYATRVEGPTAVVGTSLAERNALVLSDDEILQLARWGRAIESHYGCPMDVEWAKDGESGKLFVVQARPETVQSRSDASSIEVYELTAPGERILEGISVGGAIASGRVVRLSSPEEAERIGEGDILVTEMTDPAWGPIMERVAGIVTDQGGRTCHAAIVSRELGIPAVVGTIEATRTLEQDADVTISCAEGDVGYVYRGRLAYDVRAVGFDDVPETKTRVMLNIASPAAAFRWWRLPCEGIGLARMEFIITNTIKAHPMALLRFDEIDAMSQMQINRLTAGYPDRETYFVDRLGRGIAKIAASRYPGDVIVRMSDFKTNEYADLIGGEHFEPAEANPMLGFRGASRYYSEAYRPGFELECAAIRMVRDEIGLDNVKIMIPFCRTLGEADRVLEVLAENGLERGRDGLEVYVMCEVPSNVILADAFADRFDGFSIGSNDLTQLTLGVDRDSGPLSDLFDECDPAVTRLVSMVIEAARKKGRKVGICGQGPSDDPEFATFLVEAGIDSISLNPDSVVGIKKMIAEVERRLDAAR